MSITKDQIIGAVAAMSVMDVIELIAAMEERFGVSAGAHVAAASADMNTDMDSTESTKEKTEFDVVLISSGANKISVIKAVRSATGLGLKEAKDLVESSPAVMKEGVSKNEAEALRKSLEEIGAKVEVK